MVIEFKNGRRNILLGSIFNNRYSFPHIKLHRSRGLKVLDIFYWGANTTNLSYINLYFGLNLIYGSILYGSTQKWNLTTWKRLTNVMTHVVVSKYLSLELRQSSFYFYLHGYKSLILILYFLYSIIKHTFQQCILMAPKIVIKLFF